MRSSIPIFTAAITSALFATSITHASGDQVVPFTFEEFNPAAGGDGGIGYTDLTSTVDDVSVTITREDTDVFDIFNSSNTARPSGWGDRSLSPFLDQHNTNAFIVNLSSVIIAASIEIGDYGEDFDIATMQAFSGPDATGDKLAESVVVWGLRNLAVDPALTLSVASDGGITSLRFIGGAPGFEHSLYYDNLRLTIPTPAAASVLTLGVLALARRRR